MPTDEKQAQYHPEFKAILSRTRFLDVAYEGGMIYKNAKDQYGMPVLIEHENEMGGSNNQQLIMAAQSLLQGDFHADVLTKYGRRRRMAVYENHVKPIVDKVSGYTLRAIPSRKINEQKIIDLDLDTKIKDVISLSLKLDHYWVGIDADKLGNDSDGNPIEIETKADEANLGEPYIRTIDPRFIVDWEYDDDSEELIRIVICEPVVIKSSFTESTKTEVFYTEWTLDGWVRYKEVDDSNESGLVIDDEGSNDFHRKDANGNEVSFIPFYKFDPPFPSEDLAEMNRLLFNTMSLLDEELFGNTFTQKIITGESPENVEKTGSGVGEVMVLPDPEIGRASCRERV